MNIEPVLNAIQQQTESVLRTEMTIRPGTVSKGLAAQAAYLRAQQLQGMTELLEHFADANIPVPAIIYGYIRDEKERLNNR